MSQGAPRTTGRRAGAVAVLLLSVALSGCAGSAATSPSPTTDATPAPPTAGASATGAPSGSSGPDATATAAPTTTPAPLPVAEIVTDDASIAGALGSYDIDGRGSDTPWLPFDSVPALEVSARSTLTLRFADGTAIGDSRVVIATAADTSGASPQEVLGGALSADGTSLAVGPLPAGRWVLQARLFRADGRGDGLTYWALTIR